MVDTDSTAELSVLHQAPQLPQDPFELEQLLLLSHVVWVLLEVVLEQAHQIDNGD